MRLTGFSAKGRHRIRRKLTAWGVAAVVTGGLALGAAGALSSSGPASASATMTLSQFVSKYNGHYLDVDGVPSYKVDPVNGPYQCVDVFKAYDNYVVGSGIFPATGGNGGADAYWTNSSLNTRYTHIAANQAAQPGDVAVWGGGEGGFGHVAIVLSSAPASPASSTSKLSVLQQNPGPVKKGTIGRVFTYAGYTDTLLGFLRPKTSSTPPPVQQPPVSSPPAPYHTGRQVSIVSQATGGVTGHAGPGNQYQVGQKDYAKGSPIWIVCYVTGQSITGPYGTESIWDLSDDGWYYTDAWLYTGTNGPAVPRCSLKTVTIVSQATGGVTGHQGPGNQYTAGPNHAKSTPIQIACYVTGQSITGPYGTESIWDLAVGGYYYSDAWLYTGTNGPAVPHC